jgi:hypothetical protein
VFQLQNSDMNKVTLINLQFNTSGNYKCEVSTEAPSFATVAQNASMIVVGELRVQYFICCVCRPIA